MKLNSLVFCIASAAFTTTGAEALATEAMRPGHARLAHALDRPQDGYCLDIMGSGNHVRLDLPMTAHNCKPGLYADEAAVMEPAGYIRFPAYGVCATVAGINGRALPGASIMPRRCEEESPFLIAAPLQRFVHRDNGYLELSGSGLCLTVGERSDSTFESTHRWRTLFMVECDKAVAERSTWKFVAPSLP